VDLHTRLYGRKREFQGFFIYRHDRILQTGGWNHVVSQNKSPTLARVVIDDFAALGGLSG
jgi:hypothetical protein